MKQPLRSWMTGCLAVVSVALGAQRAAWANQPPGDAPRGDWKRSGHGVAETVQRLEAVAQRRGLMVLARWAYPARPSDGAVLVFESLAGGTPVRMRADGTEAELPLSLCVRPRPDGCAEVLLPDTAGPLEPDTALPQVVGRELTELPGVVADALT